MTTTQSTATLLAAALLPLGIAASASAAHVDFFDAGPFTLTAGDGETQTASQTVPPDATGALGGLRQVTIDNTADGTPGVIIAALQDLQPGGNDDAVNLAFGSAGSVLFEYGTFIDGNAPLAADFINIPDVSPAMNWTHLDVDFTSSTGGGTATVTLQSNGASATLTQAIQTGTHTLEFFYDDMLAQTPGLDLTSVDAASLLITGSAFADFGSAYNISFYHRDGAVPGGLPPGVIPTPAAASAGLALMGGLLLRRRRQS